MGVKLPGVSPEGDAHTGRLDQFVQGHLHTKTFCQDQIDPLRDQIDALANFYFQTQFLYSFYVFNKYQFLGKLLFQEKP